MWIIEANPGEWEVHDRVLAEEGELFPPRATTRLFGEHRQECLISHRSVPPITSSTRHSQYHDLVECEDPFCLPLRLTTLPLGRNFHFQE